MDVGKGVGHNHCWSLREAPLSLGITRNRGTSGSRSMMPHSGSLGRSPSRSLQNLESWDVKYVEQYFVAFDGGFASGFGRI